MNILDKASEYLIRAIAIARLACEAEDLTRFNSAPEWRAWHEKFAEIVSPKPEEGFTVEVRFIPEGRTDHIWAKCAGERTSIEASRAVVEDLRMSQGHLGRALRIMQGDKMIQLILPGDPPVAEFAK